MEGGDFFGRRVALAPDGLSLAVGATLEDSNSVGVDGDESNNLSSGSGAVYLYSRVGSTWSQQHYLKASNTDSSDNFGGALALSAEGSLVVGAADEDSNAVGTNGDQSDNSAFNSGAVYVFARRATDDIALTRKDMSVATNVLSNDPPAITSDVSTLTVISSPSNGSVAVNVGNGVITYTPSNEFIGEDEYVYQVCDLFSPTVCVRAIVDVNVAVPLVVPLAFEAYVKSDETSAFDRWGSSIALSNDGKTMVVGKEEDDKVAASSGAAFVFTRTGATWSQDVVLKPINPSVGGLFGRSVSISGDGLTIAVGEWLEDSRGSNSGAAHVYTKTNGTWSYQALIIGSNTEADDYFGSVVRISDDGSTLAVTANGEDSNAVGVGGDESNNDASASSAVYIFVRSGETWTQQAYIKRDTITTFGQFGFALSISGDGNTLIVGLRQDNKAVLYVRNGTTWSLDSFLVGSNTEGGDNFGASVSISSEGNTIAIGAFGEDSSASGIGGDQSNNAGSGSGAVYIFTKSGTSWTQQEYIKVRILFLVCVHFCLIFINRQVIPGPVMFLVWLCV